LLSVPEPCPWAALRVAGRGRQPHATCIAAI
jgi:hypothetical protein